MAAAATAPFLLAIAVGSAASAQMLEVTPQTDWVYDADAIHPGGTLRAALKLEIPGEFHLQSNKPLDEFLVATVLSLETPKGLTVLEIVYPEHVMFDVAGETAAVFEKEFTIGVAIEVGANVRPGSFSIPATLSYQACDSRICLMPTELKLTAEVNVVAADIPIAPTNGAVFAAIAFTGIEATAPPTPAPTVAPAPEAASDCDVLAALDGFTIAGTTAGYMGSDDFLEFIDAAEQGRVQANWLEGKGPLLIVLIVVLGGVALNLTPCVLPLIPINIAIIGAGAQSGSRARGFALGAVYGLAMAVVYGLLGLIVTLTATAFGAINGTLWFNISIATLFVVLGLAMFDIIAIDFSKFQSKLDVAGSGKRGSFAVAFGMGAVTALLAGACVAPVVIQVIVYSSDQYAKGATMALALPFFLGLGMALPWPFAGAGLSLLPKPGKWMMRVKQAMGVFILAFAAYYGYLAWGIWDNSRVDPAAVLQSVNEKLEGGWTASICEGLATAKSENRLVLIDMWATWCKNCTVMDKKTLKDDAVVARLEDYVKVKYQAEDLHASPTREMLERFEGIGLPHYAILRPKDATPGVIFNNERAP